MTSRVVLLLAWSSAPLTWGIHGSVKGWAPEVEMSPSPPLLGRVQDKQAAQAPSRLGLKNGVLSQGQFPALCRHFLSKPGRVKGTMLGLISPSKQENEVFIGIHWGGGFSMDAHLPQGCQLQGRRVPWGAGPAAEGHGGTGGWSLWHLQGQHLRLHLKVLVESDHCIPARDRQGSG